MARTPRYDAGTDTWTPFADLQEARSDLSAAVAMGAVFTMGGVNRRGTCVNTVEVFNQGNGRWQFAAPMPGAREGSSTAVINDRVYVIGGVDEEEMPLDTIHVSHPSARLPRKPFKPQPNCTIDRPTAKVAPRCLSPPPCHHWCHRRL